MRSGAGRRAGRAVLALLAGLLAGAWVGGGLVWVFNRTKLREAAGEVAPVSLAPADELALVPADAAGFAHVRAADLWRSDAMAEYRRVVGKAGDDALKALDDGFAPAPSTLDRVTVVALARPTGGGPPPGPAFKAGPPFKGGFQPPQPPVPDRPDLDAVGILTFSAPFDFTSVREANLPKGAKQVAGDGELWAEGGTALAARGDRTLLVGPVAAVRALLSKGKEKATEGPLAPALKLAAGGNRHVVGALNLKVYRLPQDLARSVPPEAVSALRADALAVGAVVGRGLKLDLRAAYKDDTTAEEAEKNLRKSAEAGRKSLAEAKKKFQEAVTGKAGGPRPRPAGELPEAVAGLFTLGAIGVLDDYLAGDPVKRSGPEVTAEVTIESVGGVYAATAALSAGLLVPSVAKVREAAVRAQDSNNLRQLALAMHNYESANGKFPPAGLVAPGANQRTRPLLSWRVALLPYVGEGQLFQQFKMDEPWDGPNNIKLLPQMPKVYAAARSAAPPGKTHYQVFVTPDTARIRTMFGPKVGRPLAHVVDGTSNTIMIVEAADPVEWTKPQDIDYDPDADLPPLGLPGAAGFQAALGDGSVRFFPATTRPETLHIWIGANDGIPNPPE